MAASQLGAAQSIAEIEDVIRAAIAGKISVRAIYDGRERLLCPHMLGRSKEGEVRILCLQIGGESASGLRRKDGDWRCLALEKFSSVRPAGEPWRTAGNSLRRPKCIDQVELEVTGRPERELQRESQ